MLWYQEAQLASTSMPAWHGKERSSWWQWRVSRPSHMVPIHAVGEGGHCLDNQNELKIPVISPGFCKELGESILPLTILWTDTKLEYICHCKEFTLLLDRWYISNTTPLLSNCLNNWELTRQYKTLQGKIFTYITPWIQSNNKETSQISSRNVDNTT